MSSADEQTILAWHAALNAGDTERLLALSTHDVEVGGSRGSGRGSDLLRDWAVRAGIRLEPGRMIGRDATVVVEQTAQWRMAESDELTEPQMAASVFRLRDGQIASVIRYADLQAALRAAGLEEQL